MSDTHATAAPVAAPPAVVDHVPGTIPEGMIDHDAAESPAETNDALRGGLAKPRDEQGKFVKPESAPQEQDTAAETPSGEAAPEIEAPAPIDPPVSWKAEDKDRFASLPRELQETIAAREKERDTEVNRTQSDAAEKSKAVLAKEQAAEQARNKYEQATSQALQHVQAELNRDFPDIKSQADIDKLATDDPFRWVQLKQRMESVQLLHSQQQQQEQIKQTEQKERFTTWAKEQDDTFTKQFPEFADTAKSEKVRGMVKNYLNDAVGIKGDDLAALWNGNDLYRDAKTQRIIYDAARFYDAQQKAKAATPRPSPAPQRAGPAASGNVSDLATAAESGNMDRYKALRAKGAVR